MSKKNMLAWVVGGLTAVLVVLILTDAWPYLRGPAPATAEWYWPYLVRPVERWWAAAAAALGLWSTAVWWMRQPAPLGRGRLTLFLMALMGWQIALQLGLVYASNPAVATELIARTYSSGYFSNTIEAWENPGLGPTLADYPHQMAVFPSEHMRTHPPGWPLFNVAAVEIMARLPRVADWLAPQVWHGRCTELWLLERPPAVAAGLWLVAWLPVLIATSTLPLAYALGRALWGVEQTARLAAVLAGTLPALLLFAPQADQIYAPVGLLVWLLVIRAGERVSKSAAYFFVAGVLLSLLTFASLGNGALVLPLGLWVAWRWWQTAVPWRTMVMGGGAAVVGGLSVWLVYWVGWGVPPWTIAQEGLRQHYALVTSQRHYGWWLIWNMVDLFIFAGWPLVLGVVLGQKKITNQSSNLPISYPPTFLLLTLLTFLALNFSGSTRGEVGRLWLFAMPLLALAAAGWWATHTTRPMSLLIAGQLALALAVGWAWQPVVAVVVVAQRPAAAAYFSSISVPIPLANTIALIGYAKNLAENHLSLTLLWEATRPSTRPYTVFNHLVSETGELVAQADGWPGQGQWPPTCWAAGEQVSDQFVLDLTAVPAGTYRLYTGFYDARDGSRPAPAVDLGVVEVR